MRARRGDDPAARPGARRRRIRSFIRRHPLGTGLAFLVGVGAFAFALYWFAPWQLFIDKRVDEARPGASPSAGSEAAPSAPSPESPVVGGTPSDPGVSSMPPPEAPDPGEQVVVLARGAFRSLEHQSSGTALLLELPGGAQVLRFEDLTTSNGPDLRVYLTDQPLSEDWHVWDDGRFVDLGALKGNLGNQNYEIPAGVDTGDFQTAVVWCRRFSVGFAVAPVEQA